MLVPGLQNKSLLTMASGSNAVLSNVHESLCECAREMLGKYRKQLESTGDTGKKEKLTIKARATEILLNELCNVPKDSAATSETIASALECHEKALQNHEHLLSKKGNTYALMQQTRALRKGHGDALAELAPLLKYHDLKDKWLASDSPLSAEKKEVITMLDTRKGLTLPVLEGMDELSRAEATGRLSYVYNGRNFPLQGSSSRGLPENFICCICLNIINQPREVCSDSHITCLECAINLKEREDAVCPQCRKSPLAKLKKNTAIERSIGNLQVHCCNDGCRSVMPISEIKSHLGLCGEEKIECPGKCIDESTNEVLRIQKKRLADHSKECSKHFKCDNCAERFPCNTETGYLKQFQIHMRNHDTDQSALSGFLTSLINKVLPQQELLLHKEVIPQTEHTGFRVPFTGWDRDGNYRFDGTDCVRTPQDWVYQSKANPRHFFVTLESPPGQFFYNRAILPFQKYSEGYRRTMDLTLKIYFSAEAGTNSRAIIKNWTVGVVGDKYNENPQNVYVTSYSSQQVDIRSSIASGDNRKYYIVPYEGNCYLFKIEI